jgi:hypothetical protein
LMLLLLLLVVVVGDEISVGGLRGFNTTPAATARLPRMGCPNEKK